MFFKILLFDFWDSGLFFEKLGNFIDISVVVFVLGVWFICICVGNRFFILIKKCRSFYEIIILMGKIGMKSV